jgi:hypothetical protein
MSRASASARPAIHVETEPRTGETITLAPGLTAEEQSTFRCYVTFDVGRSGARFELTGSWPPRRAAAAREFGYRLLRVLEALRDAISRVAPLHAFAEYSGRHAVRGLRRSVAANLLLPSTEFSPKFKTGILALSAETHESPAYEASRRVFHFEQAPRSASRTAVCHVFAAGPGEARERMLVDFARRVQAGERAVHLADRDAELVLVGRPTGGLTRRAFWEVVIGPNVPLRAIRVRGPHGPPLAPGAPAGALSPPVFPAGPVHEPEPGQPDACETHAGLVTDEFVSRGERDWDFVQERIRTAERRSRPLDETFVEEVAIEHRKLVKQDDAAGAGPGSRGASRQIVQSVVNLHLLARDAAAAADGGAQGGREPGPGSAGPAGTPPD